ncbi:MAG TPA: NAD(P)-dependent oxidoreductase [Rhizomicrobium sp.]|jgi:3-hydroxyisobutyrate dehydrogenase-like beta-hydroxyacid dehydrogenase
MKIGFIGLGQMGSGIAANILNAGHELTVWNRSPGPAKKLAGKGALVARSPADALQGDVLFSMLANDSAVHEVGVDGPLLVHARPGLVHVNLATISIDLARRLASAHVEKGLGYVAAPVFGRPDVAAAAKLIVVVAGASDSVAKVRPVLDSIGRRVEVVGEMPEQANLFKLGGNFMLAAAIESMGEAFALVRKGGVDAHLFHDVLSNSLFACPAYQGYGSAIVNAKFEPAGFPLRLGMKDVRLALDAGRDLSVALPLASLVHDHFIEASVAGLADKDWSSLSGFLASRAGL